MRFCIIGTGRCGTSLLRNILNNHPEVFVFNETHWIVKMYEMYGLGLADVHRLIHIVNSSYHITGKHIVSVDQKKLESLFDINNNITVKEFCDAIGNLFAKENNKLFWADKTPDYGPFLHLIQHIWPECKFIHIIRHGADVARSMSKHPGYQWLVSAKEDSWSTVAYNHYYKSVKTQNYRLEEFSALWSRRLLRIQSEAKLLKKGTYYELKFEDFIQNPDDHLLTITDFLNLKQESSWIQESQQLLDVERIRYKKESIDFLNTNELSLLSKIGY